MTGTSTPAVREAVLRILREAGKPLTTVEIYRRGAMWDFLSRIEVGWAVYELRTANRVATFDADNGEQRHGLAEPTDPAETETATIMELPPAPPVHPTPRSGHRSETTAPRKGRKKAERPPLPQPPNRPATAAEADQAEATAAIIDKANLRAALREVLNLPAAEALRRLVEARPGFIPAPGAGPRGTQVGGDHYASRAIQPWDVIAEYRLDYWLGNVLKYLLRHDRKGGIEDLKKARHYLDYAIEVRERAP